jgi:predicted dithiol-disulfide oxidoreductase (DUF899 family)
MKSQIDSQIDELDYRIQQLNVEIAQLRRSRPAEEVEDYVFQDWNGGDISLSECFGEHDKLILIHNMGTACSYCTMWADGFTGLLPHFCSFAAFIVTSPDPPQVQQEFARSRGWKFNMYSAHDTSFIDDMGFLDKKDGYMPGASTFERKSDGHIYRLGRTEFGPGDNYCAVWHFLDLFPNGADGWEPKTSYPMSAKRSCCHV